MSVLGDDIPGDRNAGGCGGLSAPFLDVSSQTAGADKAPAFFGARAKPENPPHSRACNSENSSHGNYTGALLLDRASALFGDDPFFIRHAA